MRSKLNFISPCILVTVFFMAGWIEAGTVKDEYQQIEALISAPDTAGPDIDFDIHVEGNILNGGSFEVFAYSIYEDADWHYSPDHLVVVTSGTLIDSKGFNFGAGYSNDYTLKKPAGTYKYTFIFGHRTSVHNHYDLAVEVHVTVEDGGSALTADRYFLFENGGIVDLTLTAGPGNANRNYLILGGITGTVPGTPLPGGATTLPLNWDLFTNLVIGLLNTPVFSSFTGMLDGSGNGMAQFNTGGALPSGSAGLTLYFAYALNTPWDFASNPVGISIVQ